MAEKQTPARGGAGVQQAISGKNKPAEDNEPRAAAQANADRVALHWSQRSPRRQHLVEMLHAAGPRPVLEALIEVANGDSLDSVLEDFGRIPPAIYRAVGADVLPIAIVGVLRGGRQ